MALPAQINTYLNTHYDGMTPEQLILMLFKGALNRLKQARQGIEENNIQKRGENLSKAIAIISELHSSVDSKMTDESTLFLRGLYASILAELPKVSINNDVAIIDRTVRYIERLAQIWETTVMNRQGAPAKKPVLKPVGKPFAAGAGGYPQGKAPASFGSISV